MRVPQQPAVPTPQNAIGLGILMMLGAVAAFAAMNLTIKLIGDGYSAIQAVFFRNAIAAVMVVPLILKTTGLKGFRTRRPLGHAVRALAGVLGVGSYFHAVARAPLADVTAISMAVPIFATVMAIPFLGEKVGWRRWSAILVGFAGILVALDPTGSFNEGSLFALIGTFFWAVTIICVKRLSQSESPYTIVLYYMVTGAALTGLFLPSVWVTPTPEHLAYYVAAGVIGGLGQILMTYALKLAPASVVSPLEYTSICWAVLFDILVWTVYPSMTTAAGATLVIFTGLYIWHREARVRGGT